MRDLDKVVLLVRSVLCDGLLDGDLSSGSLAYTANSVLPGGIICEDFSQADQVQRYDLQTGQGKAGAYFTHPGMVNPVARMMK